MDTTKRLLPVLFLLLCSCGFIDLKPRQVAVHDFNFKFETKQHPTRKELKERLVSPVADQFEPWLGQGAEKRLVHSALPPRVRIQVKVTQKKPKPPFYTVRKAGWTYPLNSSGIWREGLFDEGIGKYEMEHHFICKIWERQGKIDKCNARNYNEKKSIEWRDKHDI